MADTVFFGGTFNPPHLAHRLMLEAVADLENVERILVVPTNIPPHKAKAEYTASSEDRLNMCRLLLSGIDKATVSDMEIKRGGKSYSFDTLSELKPIYPKLMMVIGGDMITSFTSWFRYKDILKLCGILAVRRPGTEDDEFDRAVEGLRLDGGQVTVIEAEMPDISSTELRNALSNGGDEMCRLITENILEYINEKGLYIGDGK